MPAAQPVTAQPRGRPGRITRDQVVAAALKLLESGGAGSLTMAGLAKEMGVGAMSLYHYFPSKSALLDGAASSVFARFGPLDVDAEWEVAIARWVRAVDVFFARNPIALDLINWESHVAPAWLRVSLPMLHILARAGFRDRQLALAARWLISVVMGVATSKRMAARSSEPPLPSLDWLSDESRALIGAINTHYPEVADGALIDVVADNVVDGLRKLMQPPA